MTSFDAAAAAAATSFLHPTGALISRIAPYRAAHLGHNCIAELAVSFLQRMTRSAGLRLIGFQAALRFHRHSILFSVLRG